MLHADRASASTYEVVGEVKDNADFLGSFVVTAGRDGAATSAAAADAYALVALGAGAERGGASQRA